MQTSVFNLLYRLALAAIALMSFASPAAWSADVSVPCQENCRAPFVVNEFWTTAYGPAAANIVVYKQDAVNKASTNFLACYSASYALCYYSGQPQSSSQTQLPNLPCRVSKDDPKYADCRCYAFAEAMSPGLLSFVDINSIRNTEAYVETVRACGTTGANCSHMVVQANSGMTASDGPPAPVCGYLRKNTMAPDAELVSTFSNAKFNVYGTKTMSCKGTYAGCMTASCTPEAGNKGYATCKCPLHTGPYEIPAIPGAVCPDVKAGYVWSASHSVTE